MNHLHLVFIKEKGNFVGFSPHRQENEMGGCVGIDLLFFDYKLHLGWWFVKKLKHKEG